MSPGGRGVRVQLGGVGCQGGHLRLVVPRRPGTHCLLWQVQPAGLYWTVHRHVGRWLKAVCKGACRCNVPLQRLLVTAAEVREYSQRYGRVQSMTTLCLPLAGVDNRLDGRRAAGRHCERARRQAISAAHTAGAPPCAFLLLDLVLPGADETGSNRCAFTFGVCMRHLASLPPCPLVSPTQAISLDVRDSSLLHVQALLLIVPSSSLPRPSRAVDLQLQQQLHEVRLDVCAMLPVRLHSCPSCH